MSVKITLAFQRGTLIITGPAEEMVPIVTWIKWDERSKTFRAEARRYGNIALTLHKKKIPYEDNAKAFAPQQFQLKDNLPPRPHQKEALEAWNQAGRQGVVVHPTGTGKSLVARMAIMAAQRETIVLVPTIDLMHQWHAQLEEAFDISVGLLGGGDKDVQAITVSTYDSAAIHMETIGNRFGLLIADECHHLPTSATRLAAVESMAPFRLGLTATPERADGMEEELFDLMGPICHRSEILEMEGRFLAPYDLETIPVQLDDDEREAHDAAYAQYRAFVKSAGINFRRKTGWSDFIRISSRSQAGRAAFAAYRLQKKLARASRAKLRTVWELIRRHRKERILIFTDDNATAYAIGETFFLPVMTHMTKVSERKKLLAQFRNAEVMGIVTSRVLNEGVDVPEVAVGVIVSGTGSVREHVQRLGRILRPGEGKRAILYELVSADTGETYTSERRRQHQAYQKDQGTLPEC